MRSRSSSNQSSHGAIGVGNRHMKLFTLLVGLWFVSMCWFASSLTMKRSPSVSIASLRVDGQADQRFLQLSAPELINEKKEIMLDVIPTRESLPMNESFYESNFAENDTSTTIIFNVFKGKAKALYLQLKWALMQKDVEPPEVWVMAFNSPEEKMYKAVVKKIRQDFPQQANQIKFTSSDFNHKFHGRFLLAYMATTKYVLIVDDDKPIDVTTVRDYIQYMRREKGVWGNNGHLRGATFNDYKSWPKKGYNLSEVDMAEQDYLSGMWFLEQTWLEYFVKERQPSWATSEDMHLSHVMRKYLNLNTYGGKVALNKSLPHKSHAATAGSALELREFIFDHQLGRGNKVANVDQPLDTLVYAETVEDIEDFMAKLQACPSSNGSFVGDETVGQVDYIPSGNTSTRASEDSTAEMTKPWCQAGKTAAVFRGAKEQDVLGLIKASERLCILTNCTYVSAKPKIIHPIRYFNMREGYGQADTGAEVPFQTGSSDVMLSLVGVLNNVLPRQFYLPEVDNMVWPETDPKKRNRLKIYHRTALLAVDIHRNSKTNDKWKHRGETPSDGGFPTYMETLIWRRDSTEAPVVYSE